jgi:hypothetical protein
MLIASSFPIITRTDIWLIIGLVLVIWILLKACRGVRIPDPSILQGYATIANTQGGMILILLCLFGFVFVITLVFVWWCLLRGIDPQNGLVIMITGLTAGSVGAFSGALLGAMKGQDPKPPGTVTTKSEASTSTVPPPVAPSEIPPPAV